jgi:RNA polymerase sigma-70 factor (ECF subfamily)
MQGPAPTHPDDLSVATRAVAGDAQARALFATRMECVPRMLAVMNRRQRLPLPAQDVDDLVQDTLVTIWRRLDTYAGMASLETWVYRFCRFQLANRLRAVSRRPAHVPLAADAQVSEDARRLLEFEDVQAALERLPALTSDVIRLKHFGSLSFTEIGVRLALSPNTAKTRYYRGLAELRRLLGDGRDATLPADAAAPLPEAGTLGEAGA